MTIALTSPILNRPSFPPWLERLLAVTLIFNTLDIIMTLLVVLAGFAVEANPVMAAVLDTNPVVFAVVKLAMVSAGVWVLWSYRTHRLASVGSIAIFCAYTAVMAWHLRSIHILLS